MGTAFILVQLSDPHVGATWAGGDPVAGLAATVEEVRRLPDRPDAVLVSGDLADNAASAEYMAVRELVGQLDPPVHVLAGNHDDRDTMRRCFELPGPTGAPIQDSVDLGPLRLVIVDSTRPIAGRFGGTGVITAPSTYVQARLDLSADEIGFTDEPPRFAIHALVDGELTSHVHPVRH